jgi:hypothetical protein
MWPLKLHPLIVSLTMFVTRDSNPINYVARQEFE